MKARRFSWQRGTTLALAAALTFLLGGDRARSQSALLLGIDPLQILDLQVKPNVIIVLDSSGSMTQTTQGIETGTGDHPRSKMGLAKAVLQQVVSQNEDKAAFQFGQYTSDATQSGTGRGGDRWYYGTDSVSSPSMLGQEAVVNYYAFQVITTTNNTFVFGEETGASGSTEAICNFIITPGFYTDGSGAGSLAAAIQAGMNAAGTSCTAGRPSRNQYTVVWNNGSRRFDYTDTGGGTHRWRIRWGNGAPAATIRPFIVNNPLIGTPGFSNNGATYNAGTVLRLTRRDTGMTFNDAGTTYYTLRTARFWNGQTLHVLPPPATTVCDVTSGPPGDGTTANPWYVNIAIRNTCASASGTPVKFTFIGSLFGGNGISCQGFQSNVPLIPCDQTSPAQSTTIGPFLGLQVEMQVGNSADTCAAVTCPIVGYQETNDGLFTQTSAGTPGGVPAAGNTPVIQTILDVDGEAGNIAGRPQRNFTKLWNVGQTAAPGPPPVPALTAISTHGNPKESTIFIFVTDGDPTCDNVNNPGGSANNQALGAAWAAEQLYKRIDPAEPASSVQTYFVAFGNGASLTRANWIAWGGSGYTSCLVATTNGGIGARQDPSGAIVNCATPPVAPSGGDNFIRWAAAPPNKDLCPTCIDAFSAPTADELAAVLVSIINQGASSGEFSAQQSVTSNVFEYTDQIVGTDLLTGGDFGPANPSTRYAGFVPTRFLSTFNVPGWRGQFKAYTDINGDGLAEQQWSAGDELSTFVQSGMSTCSSSGTPGECTFAELHAGASDSSIAGSAAKIKRRIYTTPRNDNFALTAQQVIDRQSPGRIALWPPVPDNVAPVSNTAQGVLDDALGLPLTTTGADFTTLQNTFRACKGIGAGGAVDAAGSGHPCSSSNSAAVRAAMARREAREMILAFVAGATFVKDANGDPKRLLTPEAPIVYSARAWLLEEGTLSTPAVVAPPVAALDNEEPAPGGTGQPPTPGSKYDDEYRIFRDGLRVGATGASAGSGMDQGFALRSPDKDNLAPTTPNPPGAPVPVDDPRTSLKPVMTVVYVGTNLVLHAFRAGPCTGGTCPDVGGEELWAFAPFDQLSKLTGRYLHDPQPRDPHDYVVAASLRFGDVFVPQPCNADSTGACQAPAIGADIGGIDVNSACDAGSNGAPRCDGVWRRILYVGRGIAGKSWTALDVTNPGRYTQTADSTNPPLVYWSRGNPDTTDGKPGGPPVRAADTAAYATMGQTWSVPAVNFVRRPDVNLPALPGTDQVDFVLNMGSGFSDQSGEGHNFYTVDALTGNMIASVDVDAAAQALGPPFERLSPPFQNSIVANVASYNSGRFLPARALHPARGFTTRSYVGDQQGHVWKFLANDPTHTAIPVADIGEDQPVGSPLALFGLLGSPPTLGPALKQDDLALLHPALFGSSGYDSRIPAAGDPVPDFKNFALFDSGDDNDTNVGSPTTASTPAGIDIQFFGPNIQFLFANFFEPLFRGTLQPTTAALNNNMDPGTQIADGAVVFFGGTRFNPPGSIFAPPGPSQPGGSAPCRSSFDSIVYALEVNSGGAAFDLDGSPGNDPFTIFQDSRLVGLFTTYTPDTSSGGKLVLDEGLVKGAVQPPPPAGQPVGTVTTNYGVGTVLQAGVPAPSLRIGSTVCQ